MSFEEGESLVDCMCEVLRGTMVAMFVRQKMQQYNKRNNGQDQKNWDVNKTFEVGLISDDKIELNRLRVDGG